MKSPGAVYKKIREIKYRYLSLLYKKYLRRTPSNCLYNFKYDFREQGGKEIQLCLLHHDVKSIREKGIKESEIELFRVHICEENSTCSNCDAFINRYSKADIKHLFEKSLKVRKNYPELLALEWVLERGQHKFKLGYLEELWLKFKLFLYSL